ncbi:MAG TPA: adenosylcobinamide-GDP ribazoletransferase [Ramlibacter sp.]|nr:adenosylcobinamide-GDP ribazoletransferase [Ramlibacter sp.]
MTVHPAPRQFLRHCLAATRRFSRIPVTGSLAHWADLQPELDAASGRHWPGVGLVIGMAACMVFALVSLPLPHTAFTPLVAAVVSTGAGVLLTGGQHEQALQRQAGPPGLVLVLAAKLALLALLGLQSPAGVLAALLAGHAVSRLGGVVLAASLPQAGGRDEHPAFPARVGRPEVLVAAAWCALPLTLMALAEGVPFLLLPLATSAVALAWLRTHLRARQKGFTNDALGFVQQVCEVAFYLGAGFGVGR